jgi:hypothetical protein
MILVLRQVLLGVQKKYDGRPRPSNPASSTDEDVHRTATLGAALFP